LGGRGALLLALLCAAAYGQDDRAAALAEASGEAAATDVTLSLLLARRALETADIELARTALYTALLRGRERAILRGHGGAVACVDISPDGNAVATGSEDGTVRLWSVAGKETAVLKAGAPVQEVRFLGDGVFLRTAGELLVFDTRGKKLASFPPAPYDISGPILAITPAAGQLNLVDGNGKVIRDLKVKGSGRAAGEFTFYALTTDGRLRWYDGRGRVKMVSPAQGTSAAAFAASAPILASYGTGIAVELWSPKCKKLGELLHAGPVEQVSISAAGDRIFTASADGYYAFWTAEGKREVRVEKAGPCLFAQVSEDGTRVVTLDDGDQVTVWSWDGVPVSKRFPGVTRVTPNNRGAGLILDFKDGTRRFFHAGLGEVNSRGFLSGELSCSRWSSRGNWLFVGGTQGDAALQHWYGAGPAYLTAHTGGILNACFSEDDRLVVTGSSDGTARVWEVDPPGIPVLYHPDRVTGLGYEKERLLTCSKDMLHIREPDGSVVRSIPLASPLIWWGHGQGRVAVACKDQLTAWLYDFDGKEIAKLEHEGVVNGVEVAPDGETVVTFSADGTARLWNTRGWKLATLEHGKGVGSAAFSEDGSLVLTTADDRQARLWSADGKLKATFPIPEEIWYCVFSPKGDRLVGIPTKQSVLRVWTSQGEEVAELAGHEATICGAAFSQEGDAIVTASADGTARLWTADGRMTHVLPHPDVVYKGIFVPGGGGVLTTCKDGAVRHWSRKGQLLAVMRGHVKGVWFIECTKDGATATSASEDTTVRLWPLKRDDLLRLAKERSIRDFTPEERDRYGDLLATPE